MSILNSSYKDKSLTSIQLYLQLNSKNYSRKTKMATFHPSCRTRIVHIRCYRYFSTVASRSMAINERDKLHKLEREKEKATSFQHFDGRRLIDRKNRSASSYYSSPLRGKEHICPSRLSFAYISRPKPAIKSSTFLLSNNSLPRVWQ